MSMNFESPFIGEPHAYDEERRPVAERTMAQALARLQAWFKDPGKKLPPAEPIVDDYAVVFGYRFESGASIGDAPDASGQVFDNPHAPSGTARGSPMLSHGTSRDLHDVDGRWSAAYGVADDGAVLIRPDGFIAWRSHQLAADAEAVMRTVLERLSFRN